MPETLVHVASGKVRELFTIDDERLLLVASDRISTFDVVLPERMRANVEAGHGLFFSQRVLLALVESGLPRDEAYRLVQEHALRAWDEERDFAELVRADDDLRAQLDDAALADVFDLDATVANLDSSFDRLQRLAPKGVPISV